ncbi:GTPase ObgE [Chloroflexota bacterium]
MRDNMVIDVKAGDGGNGCISFRREKFVPYGGPDGGDGGDGGDVVVEANETVTDLRIFRHGRVYKASDGKPGKGRKKHGGKGNSRILMVPEGTVVNHLSDTEGSTLIADLEHAGSQVVVATGGKGGRGNIHFATSTNQAPEIAQQGLPGEENTISLEMRLIADVGIIGYPNAGKSTLLAKASAARPKIADYPFTTIEPALGVVEVGSKSFILAEIPGLIEGAHIGKGLGHEFLRHAMRTRVLIHLVDASLPSPVDYMVRVNAELGMYDSTLILRPQLVGVNKIDLTEVQEKRSEIKRAFSDTGIDTYLISAITGEGVTELMTAATKILDSAVVEQEIGETKTKVFRPQPRVSGISLRKEEGTFIVTAPELERLVTRDGTAGEEVRQQLQRYFARHGVKKALEKAGIKPGDKIRCGALEWEW